MLLYKNDRPYSAGDTFNESEMLARSKFLACISVKSVAMLRITNNSVVLFRSFRSQSQLNFSHSKPSC